MDEVESANVSQAAQRVEQAQDREHAAGVSAEGAIDSDAHFQGSATGAAIENGATAKNTTDDDKMNTKPQVEAPSHKPALPKERVALPTRPILKRESSTPRTASMPGLPVNSESPDSPGNPPDSLTLADLKKLREGFPIEQIKKQELPALKDIYDFEYTDAQAFPVEIEEWFGYNANEAERIFSLPDAFHEVWTVYLDKEGLDVSTRWPDLKDPTAFMKQLLHDCADSDHSARSQALASLCYLALGVLHETAGRECDDAFSLLYTSKLQQPSLVRFRSSSTQIRTTIAVVKILYELDAIRDMLDIFKRAATADLEATSRPSADSPDVSHSHDDTRVSEDLWNSMTLIHVMFEVARLKGDTKTAEMIRMKVTEHCPAYLMYLTELIGQLRWEDSSPIPISKVFTLHWKAVLLNFGGLQRLTEVRATFKDGVCNDKDKQGQPLIAASPLDYHLFRQELTSKYPAYQAPKPAFPFEPENNSILPPLRDRQSLYDKERRQNIGSQVSISNGSIMHQPMHIATPAPSPPPSPAGPGGKGGKKQNYQTNQMFPLLYPPLDVDSNDIGGKGSTELQDALVGRRWHGSDVPASILEAAELFARRMRATRAMKQLWATRVDFMKYDRGWKQDLQDLPDDDFLLDDRNGSVEKPKDAGSEKKAFTCSDDPADHIEPLDRVADFYEQSLPVLQSFVTVALKAVLKHVTDIVTQQGGRTAGPNGIPDPNIPIAPPGPPSSIGPDDSDTLDQADIIRSQEIANKALTGSLFLLLKWFKLSHILRYEYLTQLLLDSNYIPLMLKVWQSQDISRACHFKLDRPECNFYALCISQTQHMSGSSSPSQSSSDSAIPPPINLQPRRRASSTMSAHHAFPSPEETSTAVAPEVDELGYPTTPLPSSPLTVYSWRNLFTFINHLRILQKVTRRKAHRALLLVSYKSSNLLKKSLRVPVHDMRYYTLKLFKSQVSYCGRKWRQGNMKIITAVWLSVPAELRDDWLSGGGGGMGGNGPGDLEGTVEEALPLEQSLRALTYWWNCRMYPEKMRGRNGPGDAGGEVEGADRDFFAREVEKMEAHFGSLMGGLEEEEEEDALEGVAPGPGEHDFTGPF